MIKPHAIQEKNVGKIIDMILSAGFEISALELFNLDKPTATEFLEVYRVKKDEPIGFDGTGIGSASGIQLDN